MSRLTEYGCYGEFDYRCGIDRVFFFGGDTREFDLPWVVRVEWRRTGARRWESFLLVPDAPDESFLALCEKIGPAIEAQAGVASATDDCLQSSPESASEGKP